MIVWQMEVLPQRELKECTNDNRTEHSYNKQNLDKSIFERKFHFKFS